MKSTFLTNYSKPNFIEKVKASLLNCNSFYFTVSFIKKAGLIILLPEIKQALKRGAIGKIITSTYQNFTDIGSLNEFLLLQEEFHNFQCKLDYNCFGINGFHSKGYIFEYNDYFEVIVGSSNITRFALLKNIEWNISIISKNNEQHFIDSRTEFDYLWNKTIPLSNELIKKYMIQLDYAIEKWDMDYMQDVDGTISPNFMQRKALKEIRRYRDMGADKALVIAATGSGKTYLAAFDARNFDARRLLFIVHRDTILKEAISTFANVFGTKYTYGLYNANSKQLDSDFIFSTNTTMAKNLELFNKYEFDYIVIDEVHHAVADSYVKIIEYFNSQFLLGLTATPERMDNKSVFELFEKNVPYELRLREALESKLIVPFKYYGISDTLVDYSETDLKKLIKNIADNVHVDFIKEKIEMYRQPGKLKAIGFCRTIEHAKLMSEKMNELGYHTSYLIGRNDTGERLKAFNDLQEDTNILEIIFTVDLLNEGVDIPAINMVLFLRPTESSTVFIQQLGRGLRKYKGKEYLTVLDFIGNNYNRSVQIAIALGSFSNNINVDKRLLSNLVINDFKQLNLPIEVHIDEIAKDEIIKSIEETNFNSMNFLKQDYYLFKKYLGIDTYPKHMDFFNSDVSIDILRYIKNHDCLYNFLLKMEEDLPLFNDNQIGFLKYISGFLPLIRPYEFLIIKSLLDKDKNYNELLREFNQIDNFNINKFDHALNNLMNYYYSDKEKEKLKTYIKNNNDNFSLNVDLNDSFSEHVLDIINYGLSKFEVDFYECHNDIKLYYYYTRATLLQALCNHTFASREGIIWNNDNLYLFVDLKKDLTIEESLLYDDKFLSELKFQWESQTETTLENKKGQKLLNQYKAHLFVRKIKKEDGIVLPYIYIGEGVLTNPRNSKNIKSSILFDIILDNPVPDYLKYDFEVPGDEEK